MEGEQFFENERLEQNENQNERRVNGGFRGLVYVSLLSFVLVCFALLAGGYNGGRGEGFIAVTVAFRFLSHGLTSYRMGTGCGTFRGCCVFKFCILVGPVFKELPPSLSCVWAPSAHIPR